MNYNDSWSRSERRAGYADGKAGKPAIYSNQYYQRGWREGNKKRLDPLFDPDWLVGKTVRIKLQEKDMAPATNKKLFVAVVYAERAGTLDSVKPGAMGGWESFIGRTQQEAIRKAMAAQHKWFRSPVDGEKYVILVGAVTSKVKPRAEYDLVSL